MYEFIGKDDETGGIQALWKKDSQLKKLKQKKKEDKKLKWA